MQHGTKIFKKLVIIKIEMIPHKHGSRQTRARLTFNLINII